MAELAQLTDSVARLVVFFGGGFAVIALAFSAFQYMTANGEPQKLGQAKMGIIGVVVGLIVMGAAFMLPRIISETVLEPIGGVSLQSETGFDCDGTLRNQLVFQRGASNMSRINQLISQIQATRSECVVEVWDPEVKDADRVAVAADATTTPPTPAKPGCFAVSPGDEGAAALVGSSLVPAGLKVGNVITGKVRDGSGRDSGNNIIVFWSAASPPSDGARCWLYVARLRSWTENY